MRFMLIGQKESCSVQGMSCRNRTPVDISDYIKSTGEKPWRDIEVHLSKEVQMEASSARWEVDSTSRLLAKDGRSAEVGAPVTPLC